MQKKKIIIIVSVLFILIIVFVFYLFIQPRKESEKIVRPSLPKPSIPSEYGQPFSVKLNISERDFKFPATLPVITTSDTQPLTESQIVDIGKNFGFEESPTTANDIEEGKTYIWSNDQGSLLIYSKTRRISYISTRSINTINKQVENTALIDIAENFLTNKNLVSSDSINFSGLVFYRAQEFTESFSKTEKDSANIYQINFSIKATDYPIITTYPEYSPINVRILTDGEIYSAEIVKISLSPSSEEYKIKNFQEFNNSLSEAKIISVAGGEINVSDVPKGEIENATFDSVQLGYFFDTPKNQVYQPVFILKGSVVLKNTKSPLDTTLYMPALSEND
jgi:hypothetical protein